MRRRKETKDMTRVLTAAAAILIILASAITANAGETAKKHDRQKGEAQMTEYRLKDGKTLRILDGARRITVSERAVNESYGTLWCTSPTYILLNFRDPKTGKDYFVCCENETWFKTCKENGIAKDENEYLRFMTANHGKIFETDLIDATKLNPADKEAEFGGDTAGGGTRIESEIKDRRVTYDQYKIRHFLERGYIVRQSCLDGSLVISR